MTARATGRRFAQNTSLPIRMPASAPLPGRLQVEMEVPCATAFDAAGWTFSIDWEGMRALLRCDETGASLQGQTLADISNLYPEIVNTAAGFCEFGAVLDGVICVLDGEGRPDLTQTIHRRILGAEGMRTYPVVYLVTDILHHAGTSLHGWPLRRRLPLLQLFATANQRIQAPEPIETEGVALAEAANMRDLPALLARRLEAPYRPGLASPDRLQIALAERSSCVVAGISDPATLILGEYIEGQLHFAGEVAAELGNVEDDWLQDCARRWRRATPPLMDGEGRRVRWLEPKLAATFDHWGRRPDGTFQGPRLVAIRDDLDPRFCRLREPVPPPTAPTRPHVRPALAVLAGLPLEIPPPLE